MFSTKKEIAGFIALCVLSFALGMAIEAKIISSKMAATPGFEVLK